MLQMLSSVNGYVKVKSALRSLLYFFGLNYNRKGKRKRKNGKRKREMYQFKKKVFLLLINLDSLFLGLPLFELFY